MTREEYYQVFLSKGYKSDGKGGWSKDDTGMDGNRTGIQKQQDDHFHTDQRDDEEKADDDHQAGEQEDNGRHGTQFQITANFYFSDNRRRDLDNCLAALGDTLVDAGALSDDRWQVVPKIIIEGFPCAKGQERVEVTIEELE